MDPKKSIDNIKAELDNLSLLMNEKELSNCRDLKENEVVFYGLFKNEDGTSAKFRSHEGVDVLLDLNIEEVTTLLRAFGNYERFKIIILLLKRGRTANEIMDELNFKTTGKVYHHLNSLIAAGIVFKPDEYYRICAKRIQGILAMLTGCHCYISKERGDVINADELKKD